MVSSGSGHPRQEGRVGMKNEPGLCGAPGITPGKSLEAKNWRSERVGLEGSGNDDSALGHDFPDFDFLVKGVESSPFCL